MFGNVSKTNGVKLLAAVAVLAMIVCAFAVTMPADETDAASGDTQSYSGNLTWNQGFPVGTNVVINDDLTISKGTAPEDATGDDLTYSGMVVTGNLKRALDVFGINLLDSIIITHDRSYSFADEGTC